MHCVYKITFTERERNNIFPCYYIGSKSNCELKDDKLYHVYSSGKLKSTPYWGSSKYKDYKNIITSEEKEIRIIKWFEVYEECLTYEKLIHEENNVVISEKYFNKCIASENLNNVGLVVCKHSVTGKIIRLPKKHPLILDGTYVGVNKGKTHSEETKRKCSRPKEQSYWFGKNRDKETSDKISNTRTERSKTNPEYYSKITKINKERCLGKKLPDNHTIRIKCFKCEYCGRMFNKSNHKR